MSSDTPRTECLWREHVFFTNEEEAEEALYDFRDLCAKLERELNAARDTANNLTAASEESDEIIFELKAELALAREELQKERARLDWLYVQRRGVLFFTMDGPHDGAPPREFFQVDGSGLETARPTIEEAIDAAMKEDAK